MKRLRILFFAIIALLSASCSIHQGLTFNQNSNDTQVVLSKKNYKILNSVKGEAEAVYFFGIGAM